MQATLLNDEDVDYLTNLAVSSIFDALRKASGNDMTQLELCDYYFANNINRPERKAFINRFPEVYKVMAEAK
ncbi:hypothetical protein [Porticoccus sp.]